MGGVTPKTRTIERVIRRKSEGGDGDGDGDGGGGAQGAPATQSTLVAAERLCRDFGVGHTTIQVAEHAGECVTHACQSGRHN